MSTNFTKRNPFRPKSASSAIFEVLARAGKPLTAEEIRKKSKLPEAKVKTLLAAYVNPMHLAPLKRNGVALRKDEKGYSVVSVKSDPRARRPDRGQSKKRKPSKSKRGKKAKSEMRSAMRQPTASVIPSASLEHNGGNN